MSIFEHMRVGTPTLALFKGQLNLSGILLYGRLISPLIQSYQYGRMDILHFELYSNTTLFVAQVIPALAQSVIL